MSSYLTPESFRRALTDKLRMNAKQSRFTLAQLQRQIAYDRLLARLYRINEDWIVKGAVALLARDIGVRATIDIDIYREVTTEIATRDLEAAAAMDIGDWFRYQTRPPQALSAEAMGNRVPIDAYIGVTNWVSFHVDLVGHSPQMTAEPESVPAIAQVSIPEIEQHNYKAYPLVDHISDKISATLQQYGKTSRGPSTRYRDLVDLIAIITTQPIDANSQIKALHAELNRREIQPPKQFDVANHELWDRGYSSEVARSTLSTATNLKDALQLTQLFINPLLNKTAVGQWSPQTTQWENHSKPTQLSATTTIGSI